MSDIARRLRRWVFDVDAAPASDLMDEAADEIERLRAENIRLRAMCALSPNQPIPDMMS